MDKPCVAMSALLVIALALAACSDDKGNTNAPAYGSSTGSSSDAAGKSDPKDSSGTAPPEPGFQTRGKAENK